MASEQSFGTRLNRELIVFSGPQDEQQEFLQSLVSNDVASASATQLVYAALLTPQGKYLSDFFVMRTADGDLVLDVAPSLAESLLKRLTMYKLRRPITLERKATEVGVVWGAAPAGAGLADPRDPALGWRVYTDVEAALMQTSQGDYDLHRLQLSIPESETDLIPNDTYILEAGFERMNGVDFKKGCYVGQEIVARMKHKTELRKGYRKVTLSKAVAPGEAITTPDGKPAGTLYSNRDGIGLALLRLDRANAADVLHAAEATVSQAN